MKLPGRFRILCFPDSAFRSRSPPLPRRNSATRNRFPLAPVFLRRPCLPNSLRLLSTASGFDLSRMRQIREAPTSNPLGTEFEMMRSPLLLSVVVVIVSPVKSGTVHGVRRLWHLVVWESTGSVELDSCAHCGGSLVSYLEGPKVAE
eukprot:Gregarina_sp_Poly_1__7888@NODE_448_length_8319_cov_132_464615_g366_i0_p5_GENE_NODE_448_length_8319_cov_132_464615_g366_i0NODE_448_length_8319_cov_132_464615_g366_i0_p5_ORF_typecomplete_len147_score10_62DUF5451/PF17532_2/0_012zfTFIIB/PF13453_6/0_15_NODE_448_length_8319_cov_132_464615_g366_i033303770